MALGVTLTPVEIPVSPENDEKDCLGRPVGSFDGINPIRTQDNDEVSYIIARLKRDRITFGRLEVACLVVPGLVLVLTIVVNHLR